MYNTGMFVFNLQKKSQNIKKEVFEAVCLFAGFEMQDSNLRVGFV